MGKPPVKTFMVILMMVTFKDWTIKLKLAYSLKVVYRTVHKNKLECIEIYLLIIKEKTVSSGPQVKCFTQVFIKFSNYLVYY